MTQEEILECNKRCAEFLGADVQNVLRRIYIDKMEDTEMIFHNHSVDLNYYEWDGKKNIHYIPFEYLQFHSDWNWIMEVLDEIAKLDYGWKVTSKYVNIYSHSGDPRGEFDCKHQINCPKDVKLDTIRTINQFLIWYNEQRT